MAETGNFRMEALQNMMKAMVEELIQDYVKHNRKLK